jgi:hypothetical protein
MDGGDMAGTISDQEMCPTGSGPVVSTSAEWSRG